MRVDDIETALDDRDLQTIEGVFERLVRGPAEDAIGDAEDAADLARLLDRITAALEADRSPMPPDLVNALIRDADGGAWFRDDRSYAAGARAVAADRRRWWRMVGLRLGLTEDGSVAPSPVPGTGG